MQRTLCAIASSSALLAAVLSGACQRGAASPAHAELPTATLGGSYVSPASWRYHPEDQARIEAREELPDGRILLAGRRGERWLYDAKQKRLQAGASLAPEDLVAVLRGEGGSFWFVGRSGTSYEARDPLGTFVRSSTPFDRLAEVSAGSGVLLGVRVDRKLMRSADTGASWQTVGPEGVTFVDVELSRSGHALSLSLPEKLWLSRDAGATFTALDVTAQGALALERDAVSGAVRVLTPLGALRFVPDATPPLVPTEAAAPQLPELGKPPRGPSAAALAEGRAVIIAGQYLEAEPVEDGKRSWQLFRGRLDAPLAAAALEEARGCRAVRLAGSGRHVTMACFRGSAENATQVIDLFRSDDSARRFQKEGFAAHASLAAFRMAVGTGGELVVTGVCPTAVSGSGCAPAGVHHRRPLKEGMGGKKKRGVPEPPRASAPKDPKSDKPAFELGASAAPSLVDSALALAFSTDGKLGYALGRSGKTGQLALFISKDGGKSFEPEQLDLSGVRDGEYGDVSEGMRADSLTPAEDGSVGIVLSRYRTRTLVVTDELGRMISVARPPHEPSLLGAAGTRALAVAPGTRQVWESLDGGATWESAGQLPIELCAGDEQCDVPLQCSPEGCVIGHELSRIGWGGQLDEELGSLSPADASPNDAMERRVRTPLECTLSTTPFKPLPGVRELPSASEAAIGKAAWFAVGWDHDVASATTYHGIGGGKARVDSVTLLSPSTRAQSQAFVVQPQIEGAAALRYTLPTGTDRRLSNVEIAWDNLFEGRVGQAKLREGGNFVSGDFGHEAGLAQTARPDLLSIAEGGVYLRLHGSPKDRQTTYYVDGQTVVELPAISWPASATRQGRAEMARIGDDHLGLLLFGRGAAVVRAKRDGSQWRFEAGATGLATPGSFGLAQQLNITYLSGRAALHVEHDDDAGRGATAQIFPLRADGAVVDAPVSVPTQADLPVQPMPCGNSERVSSARVVTPHLPGTRHPVVVSDAVDAPRVMLTSGAVLHGTPASPCVAAFAAEPIVSDAGTTTAESAVIAPDDLEHAWLFRQVSLPAGNGMRVEYRNMSCRFSPTLEIPAELYRSPGTLAPRRR